MKMVIWQNLVQKYWNLKKLVWNDFLGKILPFIFFIFFNIAIENPASYNKILQLQNKNIKWFLAQIS